MTAIGADITNSFHVRSRNVCQTAAEKRQPVDLQWMQLLKLPSPPVLGPWRVKEPRNWARLARYLSSNATTSASSMYRASATSVSSHSDPGVLRRQIGINAASLPKGKSPPLRRTFSFSSLRNPTSPAAGATGKTTTPTPRLRFGASPVIPHHRQLAPKVDCFHHRQSVASSNHHFWRQN